MSKWIMEHKQLLVAERKISYWLNKNQFLWKDTEGVDRACVNLCELTIKNKN